MVYFFRGSSWWWWEYQLAITKYRVTLKKSINCTEALQKHCNISQFNDQCWFSFPSKWLKTQNAIFSQILSRCEAVIEHCFQFPGIKIIHWLRVESRNSQAQRNHKGNCQPTNLEMPFFPCWKMLYAMHWGSSSALSCILGRACISPPSFFLALERLFPNCVALC